MYASDHPLDRLWHRLVSIRGRRDAALARDERKGMLAEGGRAVEELGPPERLIGSVHVERVNEVVRKCVRSK